MTIRQLRRSHAHAFKMKRIHRSRGWDKRVRKLNLAILLEELRIGPRGKRDA